VASGTATWLNMAEPTKYNRKLKNYLTKLNCGSPGI
jgi:hypothetical protein